jgi:hypothetical protein
MEGAREQDRGIGGVSARTPAWLAWSLWALCMGFGVLTVLLALRTPPFPEGAPTWGVVLAVSFLAYPTVGAFVVSRRPNNLVGWILCVIGLLFGTQGFAIAYAGYALSTRPGSLPGEKIALWVSGWFDYPMLFLAAALLVLLFPDGRLPDGRWRVVPWVAVGGCVLWTLRLAMAPKVPFYFFYHPMRNPFSVEGGLALTVEVLGRLGQAALLVICVASLIAVFVRLGSAQGEERQQIKWFAYAAAVLLTAAFLGPALAGALAAIGVPWGVAIALPIWLGLLAIPVAVGVAILRYRLYDIDRIINRTLVYGAITVVLVAVYFGGIVVLQRVFVAFTGQKSTLAVVASTLVIAALFNPLRRRVQAFVDRRFYRRKYDAAKTLEAFSAKLRDETDLDALSDDLVGVVRETMQPAHVGLWLREPDRDGRRRA